MGSLMTPLTRTVHERLPRCRACLFMDGTWLALAPTPTMRSCLPRPGWTD